MFLLLINNNANGLEMTWMLMGGLRLWLDQEPHRIPRIWAVVGLPFLKYTQMHPGGNVFNS